MYGRTNGQMVRPTDGWMDGLTDNLHVQMRGCIEKRLLDQKKQNFFTFEFVKSGIVCNLFMSNSGKNLISIFGFLVRCTFK